MNLWNKVKWIYIDVIYYRYRNVTIRKKKKKQRVFENIGIPEWRINSSVNKLNEVRNYRKLLMKNIGISKIILNMKFRKSRLVTGDKFLIYKFWKRIYIYLTWIKIWIEPKIFLRYRIISWKIFRSSYTEKMFNKVKVQDNFESLLTGLF